MKKVCVRYNKVSKVERGKVFTNTKGFSDNRIPIIFTKLLELLENYKGQAEGEMVYAKWVHDVGDDFYVFDEPVANCIVELVNTIKQTIEDAYFKGKEDGKSILIQLNNGTLSINDFDGK